MLKSSWSKKCLVQIRRNAFLLTLTHQAETVSSNVRSTFEMARALCPNHDPSNEMWKFHDASIADLRSIQAK